MMGEVCVLIVTYNRKRYLMKLLENLEKQLYKINSIVIVDNCSIDDTNKELILKGYIDENNYNEVYKSKFNETDYYYYRNSVNSGGAGGFKKAFEIAEEIDCKYYWIMDDDILPQKECLKKLVENQSEKSEITIPNRNDKNFKDRIVIDINMKSIFKGINKRKSYYNSKIENNIKVVDMPFEGPLIKKSLVKKIGIPNEKYFIYYDDTDYAWRANKYTEITYVYDAVLNKQIIQKNEIKKNITWKEYYLIRNTIYFDRQYGENLRVKYIRPILIWGSLLLKNILKLKIKNLKVINKAIYDGYYMKMGKTIEPGEF